MDEQKNNYEGPAEHPTNDTTGVQPPYEQRPYVGGQFPDQRGYVHHDDYSSWGSQRYSSSGYGMTTDGNRKKPSCRWSVFFAVLLTASLTFLVTVGIGFVLFGHVVDGGDPVVTTRPDSTISSPSTEPAAKTSGIVRSRDGLSITFADQEGIKDALKSLSLPITIFEIITTRNTRTAK